MSLKMFRNLIEALERHEKLKFGLDRDFSSFSTMIDMSKIYDSESLLRELYKRNTDEMNESRNKKIIFEYLSAKKNGEVTLLYKEPEQNELFDLDYVYEHSYGGSGGAQISGTFKKRSDEEMANRGYFDYRITLRNSSDITTDEAVSFVDTLVSEANKRNLNLRMKDLWEADAVILYCDVEDLYGTVRLLEDLTNEKIYGSLVSNATKHFGEIQAFSASLRDDSYYGIAMAHSEGSFDNQVGRLTGYYGGNPGNTFGGYMEDGLNSIYDSLMNKYNGDSSKITVDEMYDKFIKYHRKYMLGDTLSDIPLWMNRRNYNDFCSKVNINNNINDNKMLSNGFYIPTDMEDERPKHR